MTMTLVLVPTAHDAFCLTHRQERLAELVDIPTPPARDLFVKEKPHAAITEAIRLKFDIHTTPKDSRADAIRQRRAAAVRRQESSAAGEGDDSIFVEVKESPRRPLQRKLVAEPTKRIPSPSRGPRSTSPGSATRAAAADVRTPSPPSSGRTVSLSRVAGSAVSSSRTTKDDACGTAGGRSVSPSRSRLTRPTYTNFRGPATSRLDGERQESSTVARPRTQKRVSIIEQSTLSDLPPRKPNNFLQSPVIQADLSSRVERDSKRTSDSTNEEAHPALHQPSADPSTSRPTSRFAAAAKDSASRTQAAHFGVSSGVLQSDDVSSDEDAEPLRSILTEAEHLSLQTEPFRAATGEEQSPIDSFFDQPIPSSAPAPMPQADVTLRDVRRNEPRHDETLNEYLLQAPVHHVPAGPVADYMHADEDLQRDLSISASEEEPPSVSINSMFHTSAMASAPDDFSTAPTPPASGVGMPSHNHLVDEGDKENMKDENLHQPNCNTDAAGPDALTKLTEIQKQLKISRQKQFGRAAGDPVNALPVTAGTGVLPCAGQQYDDQQRSVTESLQCQRANVPLSERVIGHRRDTENTEEQQPQMTSPVFTSRSMIVQAQPKSRAAQSIPPSGRPDHTTSHKSVLATQTQQKPPVDFVHQPSAFTFTPAGPPRERVQHQMQLRQGPPSHPNVDQARSRMQQTTDSQRVDNNEQTTPSSQQNVPSHPKPTVSPATGSDPGNDRESAGGHGQPSVPRQRTSFTQGDDLPANAGIDAVPSATQDPLSASGQSHGQLSAVRASHRRHTVLNPTPEKIPAGVAIKMLYPFCLVLGVVFGLSGLIQATTKVRDAYEYHNALLHRINEFESSIVDSYESVRKMDEKYSVWSEYVRELTEQDKSTALNELEGIQMEVEKWQTEMKNDLLAFKRSLSGDIIDAALAHLREPNATTEASTSATTEAST
jgi:hypothetical protein